MAFSSQRSVPIAANTDKCRDYGKHPTASPAAGAGSCPRGGCPRPRPRPRPCPYPRLCPHFRGASPGVVSIPGGLSRGSAPVPDGIPVSDPITVSVGMSPSPGGCPRKIKLTKLSEAKRASERTNERPVPRAGWVQVAWGRRRHTRVTPLLTRRQRRNEPPPRWGTSRPLENHDVFHFSSTVSIGCLAFSIDCFDRMSPRCRMKSEPPSVSSPSESRVAQYSECVFMRHAGRSSPPRSLVSCASPPSLRAGLHGVLRGVHGITSDGGPRGRVDSLRSGARERLADDGGGGITSGCPPRRRRV